ncbi:MAG: pseudouridine synthase [Bdellovibrionota bacterium]
MPSAKRHPRIDQLLASLGYGTRRDIDIWIKRGRITVQGETDPRSEMRVDPAFIRFDDDELDHPEGILIAMHKPRGHVCSHQAAEGPSVYDLLPERWKARTPRIETIGRLDRDTSGILLLTDQHDLIQKMTSPKNHVPKVYEAKVEGALTQNMVDIFAAGTLVLHGETKPCLPAKLEILETRHARVTLNEGRYHQVRRMFGSVGAPVLTLQRVAFGALKLEGIPLSCFHELEPTIESITGQA